MATPDTAQTHKNLTMEPICGKVSLSNAQVSFQCERREYWRLWEVYAALDNFDDNPTLENLKEVVKKKRMADRFFGKPE